ncbi:hypothetical protein DERF_003871 [Dermatophagoides farinae]|uniref:Uncharacterized protein n=1 Tax=Dermatophagoides farinae TaxID=6954 RepID=A0A922IF11_DERFA|nr:hypothetical protein DERF_003871 [Dermatophagoides farinae]
MVKRFDNFLQFSKKEFFFFLFASFNTTLALMIRWSILFVRSVFQTESIRFCRLPSSPLLFLCI